jgi:hypothetical protein
MDVCVFVYSVFVLSCDGLIIRPRSPNRLCKKDYELEEEARAQQRAVESFMKDWINYLIIIIVLLMSFQLNTRMSSGKQ